MQQAVGQAVGKQLQHFIGRLAVGQLLACALQQLGAGGFAERAQLPQRRLVSAGLLGLDEARYLQVDEVLELLAHGLTNRLLHPPTAALRAAALSGDADLTRAAERLFPATPGYRHPPVRPDDADPAP